MKSNVNLMTCDMCVVIGLAIPQLENKLECQCPMVTESGTYDRTNVERAINHCATQPLKTTVYYHMLVVTLVTTLVS